MKKLADLSAFNWIKEHKAKNNSKQDLRYYVPDNFKVYCKIFHSIFEDPTQIQLNKSYNDLLKEHLQNSKDFKKNDDVSIIPSASFQKEFNLNYSKKIKWKQLAERYKFPFNNELTGSKLITYLSQDDENISCPAYLSGPNLGTLNSEEMNHLVKGFINQNIYCYYDILTDVEQGDRIFEGQLSQIKETIKENNNLSPTYWWNAEKTWVIWTDYDQCYTIVGGSKNLIEEICNNPFLEALEIPLSVKVN